MIKKIPVFEIVCAGAVIFLVAVWFKTGANVLPSLVFWALLLALLISGRLKSRFAAWLQLCLVVIVLVNNTFSWHRGNLSTLQFIALSVLFLGCVGWMYLARLIEADDETEAEKGFEQEDPPLQSDRPRSD